MSSYACLTCPTCSKQFVPAVEQKNAWNCAVCKRIISQGITTLIRFADESIADYVLRCKGLPPRRSHRVSRRILSAMSERINSSND